jgi:hypothetical protein
MKKMIRLLTAALLLCSSAQAQVNQVEFGKNRVQYKKFKWRYFQSPNFNVYFHQGGLDLAKFVVQVAEKELPGIENFVEYASQRRINFVLYNTFDDMQQSNIGLGIDWQNTGGVTKLVNNKAVIYFDSKHDNLRRQIREGIARVLVENFLFGDDLGEFASNQALLDLPKWMTDGYISYAGENWSTDWDNKLKVELLSGNYNNFYQLAYDKPVLAGHAFWHFIATHYKKENVTYFLYLARLYKTLNAASQKICKKKFKYLLSEFMEKETDKYYKDIRSRRNRPKGIISVTEEVGKSDFYQFNVNPQKKNNTYAVVEFKRGLYCVKLVDNMSEVKILYKSGVRTRENEINPNYPMMAWDPKGTRLAVLLWEAGKLKFFVYDLFSRIKRDKQEWQDKFDQVQSMQYMLDANTLVLSAVKNGHSDIYIYKIEQQKVEQITNDVYDDLDASFVAFPNKQGILFSSNRPSADAPKGDTILPSNYRYNVFLVDNWNKTEFRQISQLSNLKYGNARYPTQYNNYHFTFVADENGISNRYAGFFTTQRAGFDTLYWVGDDILRNPGPKDLDSAMIAWNKKEPDSVGYVSITKDSAYTFPITNYQSNLLETRIAGEGGQVSEVMQEGDLKFLYKLRIDTATLRKRNINPRLTEYMKQYREQLRIESGIATGSKGNAVADSLKKANVDVFQTEFADEKKSDSAVKTGQVVTGTVAAEEEVPVLQRSKIFDYRLKFSTDYALAGVNNSVLVTTLQPYGGGLGPIYLSNGSPINGVIRMGTSDIFEDVKFTGGYRLGDNLNNSDWLFQFDYLKKRLDMGFTFYRTSQNVGVMGTYQGTDFTAGAKLITNLYQVNLKWPFDRTRSIRLHVGYRSDRTIVKPNASIIDSFLYTALLKEPDFIQKYAMTRLEYVHDNTINPANNIWNGLRWKIYMDLNTTVDRKNTSTGKAMYNLGVDARYYYKIYRNFIWAGRVAADFSWGTQKIIYYAGGVDGWLSPKFNNNPQPDPTQPYAFQSLAVNLRGFNQNVANGNNNIIINSEFRLPVFSTLFNNPINNAFLRNFQLVQFFDLGNAWEGTFNFKNFKRPTLLYSGQAPGDPSVLVKAGGIGPFAGGYGFGARSTLLGYFLRVDASWPMKGVFRGVPIWYFSMGFDF